MPKGLDWDSWLATASFHDYSKDFDQGEWRSWYDFGNGCLGDWGAHTMDTMHRFFNLGLPTEVQIRDVQGWNPYVFPMQDTLTFRFDPASKTIVGDEEANALLKGSKGTPRKGWEEFYRV